MSRRRLLLANSHAEGGDGNYPPANEIWYTTHNRSVYSGYGIDDTDYGATLISNTYKNGKGVMVFNGAVAKLSGTGFEDDQNIKSLMFPDTMTTIMSYAFNSAPYLEELWLGKGVTTIGSYALSSIGYSCDSVKIYVRATTPPTLENGIIGNVLKATIYVPMASVNDYKTALGWEDAVIEGYDF